MSKTVRKIVAIIIIVALFVLIFGVLAASSGGRVGFIPAVIFMFLAPFIWKSLTKDKDTDDKNDKTDK